MKTDREKLINWIKNTYVFYSRYVYKAVVDDTAAATIADCLIANGVKVQRWIPVTERLPNKAMKCLVYTKRGKCGGYEITYYDQGFCTQYAEVTHWMPLPEPPKEGE